MDKSVNTSLLRPEFGEKVHLERAGQLRGGAKGEVHVLAEYLGDVWLRDLHARRQLRLRDAKLLHAPEDAAKERGAYVVYGSHGKSRFQTRSRPVEYAAEYFTSPRAAQIMV